MSRMPKASTTIQNPSVQQNNLINTAMLNQNNPELMGKTVLQTVYQNQSQLPNQTVYSTIPLQRQRSNSFNNIQNTNNNPNSQVKSNIPNQNMNAKTTIRTSNTPNRLSSIETAKTGQIPKSQFVKESKFKNITINKNGKQISNVDLNDDTQGGNDNIDILANSAQSVYPTSKESAMKSQKGQLQTLNQQIASQPQVSNINPSVHPQQTINNQTIYTTIQLVPNQSVQNTNKQSIQQINPSQKASSHQSIQQNNAQNSALTNTNTANIMGQTVVNTVYANQNTNINSTLQKQSINNTQHSNANAHPQLSKTEVNPNNIASRAPNQNPPQLNKTAINPYNNASRAPNQNSHMHQTQHSNQNQNSIMQSHQSKHPSSSTHQSNQPIQQGSQVRESHKESQKQNNNNNLNESKKSSRRSLLKKSSLKASRNKSPPQVIKTPDGKIKRSEIDSNGNSYFVETDKELPDICTNLNKYLENEIKHSQLKESKPENPKKGNGFRYFGQLTKAGRNQNGQKKTNQDTPLAHLNVGGIAGFNLFGVLDGHGPHGHFVSQFCRDHFIKYMTNFAEACLQKKIKTPEAIYNELKNNKYSFIFDIFHKADVEMSKQKNFDTNFSGTTCNIVFQFNKYLVCASVGDSRGILIEDKGDGKNLGIVELSHDHKPDLPGERDRIESRGGFVDKITDYFGDKVGPPRVWKAGTNYPGLAMSRSLGDFQAKQCGVIATPEIKEYTLNRNSKYLIICSDGVWEFIQNEQVRDLGNVYFNKNDVGGFCTELVKFAVHSWEQFDIIRDDITVVSTYF